MQEVIKRNLDKIHSKEINHSEFRFNSWDAHMIKDLHKAVLDLYTKIQVMDQGSFFQTRVQLLEAKRALFSMVNQFMYTSVDDSGQEYFTTDCESAGEHAFKALGFETDVISKEEFYKAYDALNAELSGLLNERPASCTHLEAYQKYKQSEQYMPETKALVKLVLDKDDIEFLHKHIDFETRSELAHALLKYFWAQMDKEEEIKP